MRRSCWCMNIEKVSLFQGWCLDNAWRFKRHQFSKGCGCFVAALPPGVLGIALDSSACSGKVSGETCQLQCSQGYDLLGAMWWSDCCCSFHLKNATLHVYPIAIWIGHSCLLLKSTHTKGTVIIGQYQYKLESVGLRSPLAVATGDASLTCQAETSTFTSSSAVCEPRCKTKVLEVAFFRKGTATRNWRGWYTVPVCKRIFTSSLVRVWIGSGDTVYLSLYIYIIYLYIICIHVHSTTAGLGAMDMTFPIAAATGTPNHGHGSLQIFRQYCFNIDSQVLLYRHMSHVGQSTKWKRVLQ